MAQTTNLDTLKINYMTQEQYDGLTTKNENEIYLTPQAEVMQDLLNQVDYGSQFTHNYAGSECHIYKIGKIVFFEYGTYWGGYSVNSIYNIGTLPAALRPAYQQITVGQVHAPNASSETQLTVNIQTDGVVTLGTGGWQSATVGYPWFTCFYFLS